MEKRGGASEMTKEHDERINIVEGLLYVRRHLG